MKAQIVLLFFLCSCKPNKSIFGIYYRVGKDYNYQVELKADSTFYLSKQNFDVNSSCSGKWYMKNKATVALKCNQSNVEDQLAKGYLNERSQFAVIINPNSLRMDGLKLSKKRPN